MLQGYAEIDPSFITQYFNQLRKKWLIYNNQGAFNTIEFNKSYENPIISIGWTKLAESFQLPNNVEIELSYYGKNLFEVIAVKEASLPTTINPFHSRSIHPRLTKTFDFILNIGQIDCAELLLPPALGNYLQHNDYQQLLLCGDNNKKATVQNWLT
ncbi:hypothetical protein TSUD_145340 [Trifolium subterraneum]|uniref:TF-B3 domain-containing protein n=1 Tax=Trifolium subterraneum TaxID=3900 RepID=A0A2Z6NLN3_TRISU|nr:hypothetical protein TSUD_145340 [Trifolium subterraneum]